MLRTILVAGSITIASIAGPARGLERRATDVPKPLAALRGHKRALLIFDSEPKDSSLKSGISASGVLVREQLRNLESHRSELKERDVQLVVVPEKSAMGGDAVRRDWIEVRRQFDVPAARFTVVFVGKDGFEKFRSYRPVTIEKLVALIDAMPMRQQEIRDGHNQ